MTAHQLLHAYLEDAVGELFASYDCPIRPSAIVDPLVSAGESVISTISFSHRTVSGSLTLIGSVTVVRALFAATGVELRTTADLVDAAGELTNMVLGRIKNKSAIRDLMLKLGTPTTMHGLDLMLSRPPSETSSYSVFEAADARLYLRLDTLAAAGFTHQLPRLTGRNPVIAEGTALLFED